jgi:hypothetical protein
MYCGAIFYSVAGGGGVAPSSSSFVGGGCRALWRSASGKKRVADDGARPALMLLPLSAELLAYCLLRRARLSPAAPALGASGCVSRADDRSTGARRARTTGAHECVVRGRPEHRSVSRVACGRPEHGSASRADNRSTGARRARTTGAPEHVACGRPEHGSASRTNDRSTGTAASRLYAMEEAGPASGSRGGHRGGQATDHHHFLGVVNEHGRKSRFVDGRLAPSMEEDCGGNPVDCGLAPSVEEDCGGNPVDCGCGRGPSPLPGVVMSTGSRK